MSKHKLVIKKITLLGIVVLLSSCGGGGGSGAAITDPTTPTVSGTAASGAPIVGIVNVLGANGLSASSLIESDGSYSIDVALLTPPFISSIRPLSISPFMMSKPLKKPGWLSNSRALRRSLLHWVQPGLSW